jgi:hypothetical protein
MNLQRFLSKYPAKVLISTSLSCAVVASSSRPAGAQTSTLTTCIGGPAAVPGLSGAPNWFGTEPASSTNETGSRLDIDEPRWASAPLMPFDGTMSSGSPTYRILKYENYLYVSFHAPVGSTGTDAIFFGFSEGPAATKPAYLIQIQPAFSEGAPDPLPTPVGHIQIFNPTNNSWSQASTPGWLQDVRTWRSPETGLAFGVNFRIAYKTTGTSDNSSATTAKVVLSRTQPFRTFFGMGIKVEPEFTLEYTTPVFSPLVTNFVNTGIHVPADISLWAQYDGVSSPCREGVTIDPYNIRTGHPNGCSLYTGDPVAQNTFTVEPQNIRGNVPQFGPDVVRVQLALAEWGGLFPDSQANWKVIDGTGGGSMSSGNWTWAWNPLPTGPAPDTFGSASIGFTCDLLGNTYCPTLNLADPSTVTPPEVVNQALLATLSLDPNTNNSGPLRIKRGAAYMNMIPLGLSQAKRMATISLRGTPQPKDASVKQRDVYVRVVRRNMPPHGDAMLAPPLEATQRIARFLRAPGPSPFQLLPFEGDPEPTSYVPPGKGAIGPQKAVPPGANYGKPQKPGDVPPPNPKEPPKPKEPGTSLPYPLPFEYSSATTHELVSRSLPVYEVHSYYDTGETVPDGKGKRRKVLRALAPFGYVLSHNAPFYGFSARMRGVGCSLNEVQPDVYKVSVPVDGSVQIETTLSAEELPKSATCCNQKPPIVHVHVNPRGCYCAAPGSGGDGSKLLPLAVLPVALLIWRRKRRSRA